jgi:pimeloyl-ACP methyl ester carboxylesterase
MEECPRVGLTEKRQEAGGCRFAYLEGGAGRQGALPLVFLHGWALAGYTFRDGLVRLARHRRVVAPDLPGFHHSLCSIAGWDYEKFARTIWVLTQALGLARFHLAGHSTGGGIAVMLAAEYPENVASLTLIDSAGVPLGSAWKVLARKMVEQPEQAWATGLARQHWPMVTSFLYNVLLRTANTWHTTHLPLRLDVRPQMRRVRAPCLLVWGANDRTLPPAMGRALAEALPGAAFKLLPRAYHEWSVLRPDWLEQVVEEFIRPLG